MRFTGKSPRRQRLLSSTAAPLLLAAVTLHGLLAISCQSDRSEFGAEFIPKEEQQAMVTDSVGSLEISIEKSNSRNVKNFTSFAIGEVYDATYGKSRCALSAEFFSISDLQQSFKKDGEAESIALTLYVRNHYGSGQVKLSVYEAKTETHSATKENIPGVPHGDLLGEAIADETADSIQVKLPKALGTRIGRALAANQYDVQKFRKEFAGLFITAERVSTSSHGTMFYFNAGDPKTGLRISWLNEKQEKQTILLPILLRENRCNWIDNDFSGSKVEATLGKSSQEQETSGIAYLVGDGGTELVVDFAPFYKEWKAKGLVAVQRAQLLIATDASNVPGADTITYGLASYTSDGSRYNPIIDANQSSNAYGGLYDPRKRCYVLNITGYIQSLLNMRDYPAALRILPASEYRGICRIAVGTGHNPKAPARLVITYTKL